MADPQKPKSPLPGGEISVERRMLLAFVLVGVVLLLSQWLFSPKAPSRTGAKQTKPATVEQVKPPVETPPASVQSKAAAEPAKPVAAGNEQLTTVDTKVFRIVFSNRGGVVRELATENYKDRRANPSNW